MAYRIILVPLLGEAADQGALDAARVIGSSCSHAHIVGLHVRQPLVSLISGTMYDAVPLPGTLIQKIEDDRATQVAAARNQFEAWRKAAAIGTATTPCGQAGLTCEWIEMEAPVAAEIALRARTADLVILPRAARDYALASDEGLHGALFDSGRPVLIVPDSVAPHRFDTVVIAWNDSREAAHAVAAAWSLIGRAKRTVIFTGGGNEASREAAQRLAQHLAWRGYGQAEVVAEASSDAGSSLLAVAARERADLIVMGAYTHSRLRHLAFGGVTTHVLKHCTVPVLMAH
jgi:nucleotide-binding universal stress UspA family protein